MLIGLVVVALVAVGWWRRAHLRAMIQLTERHRRLGPDGVVIGGEGFVLARADAPAVLLLHGAGDTPQTLRYLAGALHANGFHVAVPLLPGHGRSVRDFIRVTADQLTAAARSSYAALKSTHDWVGVIGLSMGGALAVQLAADDPQLPALGLAAPYLAMPRKIERAARLARLWGPLVPIVRSGEGLSVLDPVERDRNLAYGVFSAAGLRALRLTMRRAIDGAPRVAAPTLVVQSRQDNRISVAEAERAFARLGSREKRLEWVSGGAHIITVDYGRDEVIALLTAWMQTHSAVGKTAG
ncbi:MAG: putative esterase [Gemmatimonadetes bacterium]|nr:putative esterase [Gemmatimonadota bacterium]